MSDSSTTPPTQHRPATIDPLDLYNTRQDIKQYDVSKDDLIRHNNSLYVDPLELAASDKQQLDDAQAAAAEAHERLMAKTGGQAVEEDLGGWLLAITISLIVIIVLLVSDIITGILMMFGGSVWGILQVIGGAALCFLFSISLYDIFTRRNPLKWLTVVCIILVISAAIDLLGGYGAFVITAIRNQLATGHNGLASLLTTLSTAITVAAKIALAIGLYWYFVNSRRVRRTLIHTDVVDVPKNGTPGSRFNVPRY